MAMGTSTGNDSNFENTVDKFSQVEKDENKNVDEQEVKEDVVEKKDTDEAKVEEAEETQVVESLSPTSGTDFEQLVGNFSQVEKDSNKNVDESKDIVTPAQTVTPFEKVLESCQHALDEKEEVVEDEDPVVAAEKWLEKATPEEIIADLAGTATKDLPSELEALTRLSKAGHDVDLAIATVQKEILRRKKAVEEDAVEEETTDEACGKKHEVEEEAVPDAHIVAKEEDEAIRVKHPLVKDEKCDKEKVKEEDEDEAIDSENKSEEVKEEAIVEEGLAAGSDNLIYIAKQSLGDGWDVFKTKEGSNSSISMFTLNTEEEALEAGQKIADAIGGEFRGKEDPRVDSRTPAEEAPAEETPAEEESNTDVSMESNWHEFASHYGFMIKDLDTFARQMGFDDFAHMDISINPKMLKDRDPEKFEDALSGFVGSADESIKEDVVEEEVEDESNLKESGERKEVEEILTARGYTLKDEQKSATGVHLEFEKNGGVIKVFVENEYHDPFRKEEKVEEEATEDAVEEEVLDEKKLKDFSDVELQDLMNTIAKAGSWEKVSSLMDELQNEIGRRHRESEPNESKE